MRGKLAGVELDLLVEALGKLDVLVARWRGQAGGRRDGGLRPAVATLPVAGVVSIARRGLALGA